MSISTFGASGLSVYGPPYRAPTRTGRGGVAANRGKAGDFGSRGSLWAGVQASHLVRGARSLLRQLFRVQRVVFFSAEVEAVPAPIASFGNSIEFVIAGPGGMAKYREQLVSKFGRSDKLLSQRLAAGNQPLLAISDGAVVAMVWIAFESQYVSEVGMNLRLKDDEFVTFDAATLPEWRGRGISTALNRLADSTCSQRAKTQHLAWRESGNAPAMRVAARLGQRKVAVATAIWILGAQRHFTLEVLGSGVAPALS